MQKNKTLSCLDFYYLPFVDFACPEHNFKKLSNIFFLIHTPNIDRKS